MANTQLINSIVGYGLQNKKTKQEIYSALLSAGVADPTSTAGYVKNLEDQGMFKYDAQTTQGVDPKKQYDDALKFALDNKNSDDVNMKTRANKFLLDVDSKKILPNGYKVEDDVVSSILQDPQIYHDTMANTSMPDKTKINQELAKAGFSFPRKLNATEKEAQVQAESGIASIADMRSEVFNPDGSIRTGNLVQEAMPFALGAQELRRMKNDAKDILTRIRTGAALNESEVKFYSQLVPSATDSAESAKYKLDQLEVLYSGISGSEVNLKGQDGKVIKYDDMFDPRQRAEVRAAMKNGFELYHPSQFGQVYGKTVVEGDPANDMNQEVKKNDNQTSQQPGQTQNQQSAPETDNSFLGNLKKGYAQIPKIANKVGDFIGTKKLGQGIGTTLFLKTKEGKELQDKAVQGDKIAIDTLQGILDEAPNAKELIGSAALTALNIASAGTLKGAQALGAAGKIATGAGVGAGYGAAGAMEQDKDLKEGAKQTAIGAVAGGALSAIGVIASKIKNALSKGGQTLAERTMNSAVKPSIQETEKVIERGGKTLGRELIDRNVKGGNKKLFEIAKTQLKENGQQLDNVLNKHSDKIITRSDIIRDFKSLIKEKMGTPTSVAQKDLEKIKSAFKLIPEKFNVVEANKIKRRLYKELGSKAFKLDPNLSAQAEISEKIADSIRKNIEKKTGDVAVRMLNKELSIFKQLKDSARDNISRTTRNQQAGVGTIGAMVEKILGAVPVKTRASIKIDKLSKLIGKINAEAPGRISKQAILNAINESMK